MFYLVLLIILSAGFISWLNRALRENIAKKREELILCKGKLEELIQENEKLKIGNAGLESFAEEIIALYDISKDICKSLEKEEIFAIFREKINSLLEIEDCLFLEEGTGLAAYHDYVLFPLAIETRQIGYLAAKRVKKQDREKFQISAHLFLLGIKRAILYQQVEDLSITDTLTGVFTRRYFLERFKEELERAHKFKLNLSFLMIDIDHFKEFNDRYGHLVGDAVLREVSRTIKENIRQVDFLGRFGGEELSIVMPETDHEQVRFAAERIRKAVESKPLSIYDEKLKATISLGASVYPSGDNTISGLIEKADQVLYQAKEAGRNQVRIYPAS